MSLTLTCDECGRSVPVNDREMRWYSLGLALGGELMTGQNMDGGALVYLTYCSPACVAAKLFPPEPVDHFNAVNFGPASADEPALAFVEPDEATEPPAPVTIIQEPARRRRRLP